MQCSKLWLSGAIVYLKLLFGIFHILLSKNDTKHQLRSTKQFEKTFQTTQVFYLVFMFRLRLCYTSFHTKAALKSDNPILNRRDEENLPPLSDMQSS